MSGQEIYAYFLAPLIMLAFGLGMVGLTKLVERWERRAERVERTAR